jgi:glycosyltransferase involved in cell wall biosynthesis
MTKPLKILYHHRVAAQDGQSVHIKELTAAFKELGHELIFVGPSLRPRDFGDESKLLAWVRKLLPQVAQEYLEILYGYRAYRKLVAAYKEHKPDVLYERHNLFLPAGWMLKRKTGIPYLVEVNAPLSEERAKYSGLKLKATGRRSEQKCWHEADMNFPVSNVLADHLRSCGVKDQSITVMHNGINHIDYEKQDTDKIRKQYGLEGKTVLGFTGFLREWHRLDLVIRTIAEYDAADSPHMLVVGEGPAVAECIQLAADLNIADRIHFAGFRERKEIPEYLAAMDIALQPAVTDYASPLKIFEYMRSSLATVAPNQPNIKEILEDGETALLFEPSDFASAQHQIKRLVDDKALREKLGTAARKAIDTEGYTWRDNAIRISKIAQDLIKGR